MSDFWKNYDSKSTFDGYISKEKKLRSHAKIIAGILEKYGKKKLQEIEKNCQSTISARGIILEFMLQTIELKRKNGL